MSDRSRPDHWTQRAKREGFPARSVFKLDEIVARTPVLPRGARVVDLGCTPGSWGRYVARVCGPSARLVGVDINPPDGYAGLYLQGSIEDVSPQAITDALGGLADAVLSDMAPPTTGDRYGDHLRQVALAEAALALATAVLRPGGAFVVKVFDGRDAPAFTKMVAARFQSVRRMKPKAVRSESVEFYLVATGFKGAVEALSSPAPGSSG